MTASASQNIVRVPLHERAYDIDIGAGNLRDTGAFVTHRATLSHAVVITDEHVHSLHATKVATSLETHCQRVDLVTVEAGEKSKSIEQAQWLWDKLLQLKTDRQSIIVAVGGGVIGDLAGFVAATFARGLTFFQVPTTLLAQVDSSVGGKVGINLPEAKNMIGAFWQPHGVVIDVQVLETLPIREYRAGLAEVVKYGVILDAAFFQLLEENTADVNRRDPQILRAIITRCCELKAEVVSQDEREESGLRAVLNYGHTFCHAFEYVTGYGQLLHGEAVSIGMLCASRLAERVGRIDKTLTERQKQLLVALGLPTAVPDVDHDDIMAAMQRDKKVAHGKLRFVLPTQLGHVELVDDIKPEVAREILQQA